MISKINYQIRATGAADEFLINQTDSSKYFKRFLLKDDITYILGVICTASAN